MTALAVALTVTESDRLAECEATIERGFQTFAEVGTALLEIRDSRLYRSEFGTFEDYCQTRWGMTRAYANRTIAAAQVVADLAPMGAIPTSERQARELVGLPAETAAAVMTAAVDATDGKPTAAAIREAREEIAPKPKHVVTETRTTVETLTVDAETGELLDQPEPAPKLPPIRKPAWQLAAEAERQNAEQEVRSIAAALMNLSSVQYPEARTRIRAAFAKHADAAPPNDRAMHTPERIRALAGWLNTYADEMER